MDQTYNYLESLTICYSGDSLKSFPLHLFPRLNRLHIENCSNLESLSYSGELGRAMTSLTVLQISWCPEFVSFPKGGLPAPNLKWVWVEGCVNLKSLPERMHYLPSLQDLYISECPELVSFPEGRLPSSLCTLSIFSCERLIASQTKWNLERLTSLQYFSIGQSRADLEGFPQEGLLPSSLVSLHISGLEKLKSLEIEGLQHLMSLKELKISTCHELESIPVEGLPSSLEFIQISDCPLLKKKYQDEQGRGIAQNVCIRIDDEVILCQ